MSAEAVFLAVGADKEQTLAKYFKHLYFCDVISIGLCLLLGTWRKGYLAICCQACCNIWAYLGREEMIGKNIGNFP